MCGSRTLNLRLTMRLLPRGKQRRAWVLLWSICLVLGFLQLNDLIYEYRHSRYEDKLHDISIPLKNVSVPVSSINTKINTTVLQSVTRSTFAVTLKPTEEYGPAGFVLNFSVRDALQYGKFRQKKGFLTIAIPSVKRVAVNYLFDTIASLIENSSPGDKQDVTIVVMFCDDDQEWNNERALNLSNIYEEYVESGFIQILVFIPQNFPDFNKLPRTYNDSVDRLKWRSKQNIHYAFLFRYCQNISDYYIHLEDDVSAATNFISDIRKYSRIKQNDWFLIRFSNMGFIGIFFRSSDLLTVSDFFLLFYAVQPCDFLMNIIANIKLQTKEIRYRPSLFQHQGIISSLKNKKQIVVDKYFKGGKPLARRKKYYNVNPPAELDTTMVVYEDFTPENAYKISDQYFWAVSPQKGQTYTIVLKKPETLSRIIVVGGDEAKKMDFIVDGEIEVSSSQHCSEWTTLGNLLNGSYDTTSFKNKTELAVHLRNVTCVQIEVKKSQNNWAIISEIALLESPQTKV